MFVNLRQDPKFSDDFYIYIYWDVDWPQTLAVLHRLILSDGNMVGDLLNFSNLIDFLNVTLSNAIVRYTQSFKRQNISLCECATFDITDFAGFLLVFLSIHFVNALISSDNCANVRFQSNLKDWHQK